MFLREQPTTTLAEYREQIDADHPFVMDIQGSAVDFDFDSARIVLGDEASVPVTLNGLQAFGDWVQVPGKFIERIDDELRKTVLDHFYQRGKAGTVRVIFTREGVEQVVDPEAKLIDPRRLIDVAAKVISPEALVVEGWQTKDEFRLDVICPPEWHRGWGGDLAQGDITRGGVRMGQNRKANTAPWVSEYLYRLACTNGMERLDPTIKLDARGQTVEQVLAEFEELAERAFSRVERSIASFYEMRDVRVDNPEREIVRLAQERNLPERTIYRLVESAPNVENMFDLVNAFSNQANDPAIRTKSAPRRNLELASGAFVGEHAERCTHCRARLDI